MLAGSPQLLLLSDVARALFLDWEVQARAVVETLRLDVGNYPHDRAARELIAELEERSPEFRRWWEEHRVYQRKFGVIRWSASSPSITRRSPSPATQTRGSLHLHDP